MRKLERLQLLKDMIQEAIDRGASSVEQVHQYIAELPFDALEKAGVLDDDKLKLKAKQRNTIGMVYDAIRRINREIGQLISDQFENLEESQHVAKVLNEKSAKPKSASAGKTRVKSRAKAE
ncbi:MAG: hypothetical protein V4607_17175 [Pseudomonadota bacterium]